MQVLPKDSHKKERAMCSLAETLSRLWGSKPHPGIVPVGAIDAEQCQCKIFAKMHLRDVEQGSNYKDPITGNLFIPDFYLNKNFTLLISSYKMFESIKMENHLALIHSLCLRDSRIMQISLSGQTSTFSKLVMVIGPSGVQFVL